MNIFFEMKKSCPTLEQPFFNISMIEQINDGEWTR